MAWAINQQISVLPRSEKPEHIKENKNAENIQISKEDIEYVKNSNVKKFCWNPNQVI